MLVFAGFPQSNFPQTDARHTRQQFSSLNVLARAAYFEQEIINAARVEGVDPKLLWTIAYNETRFRPWLTSNKGAKGMMQFIPATAPRFGLNDPYEPTASIVAAARYVKLLSRMFGGRLDSVLAAYNAGEGAVSAFLYGRPLRAGGKTINAQGRRTIGGVPPYTETVGYVGRGLKVYKWLESRGKFAGAAIRAGFPAVISASVFRVPLVDPELGKISGFVQSNAAETRLTRIARTAQKEMEAPPRNSSEVYYDPRSGSRFLFHNGSENMIKLPQAGPVIVSLDTRSGISSPARTTFVAAPARK